MAKKLCQDLTRAMWFITPTCYVDDILCIHHDPMSVMNRINGYLPLKPSSVGNPEIYLGAKLKQSQLPNWVMVWGLSPSKYIVQEVNSLSAMDGHDRPLLN